MATAESREWVAQENRRVSDCVCAHTHTHVHTRARAHTQIHARRAGAEVSTLQEFSQIQPASLLPPSHLPALCPSLVIPPREVAPRTKPQSLLLQRPGQPARRKEIVATHNSYLSFRPCHIPRNRLKVTQMTRKRRSTNTLAKGEITFLYSGSRECFRGDSLGDDLVPCVLSLMRGF